jgi:hypothetical protein
VRIIEADLDVHGADRTRLGNSYRLITVLDWRRYPAGELVRLCYALRGDRGRLSRAAAFPLGGYVLLSCDRAGAEQELWALLAVYRALRMTRTADAEAAEADLDRAASGCVFVTLRS